MVRSYWHKQGTEPLFGDLVWSRPQNKLHAGKLLIIGGNLHGFSAPASAYNESVKSGIGTAHVLLPSSLKKIVGAFLETADFAPSTPSGSFAKSSLAELVSHASWADGVLLAGDLGRNSETAIFMESFVGKYSGQLVVTKDAVDYFNSNPKSLLNRPETTLVLSIAQLQRLAQESHYPEAVTFGMDLLHLIDWLHQFTTKYACNIVTKHLETIFVAVNGKVSTTKTDHSLEDIWRVPTASACAVWWIQNPGKPYEALTSSLIAPN